MPHDPKVVEGVARALDPELWDNECMIPVSGGPGVFPYRKQLTRSATAALDAIEAMGMVVVPAADIEETDELLGLMFEALGSPEATDRMRAAYLATRSGAQP